MAAVPPLNSFPLDLQEKVSHFLERFPWWRRPYWIHGPSGDNEYLYREADHRVMIVVEYTLGAQEGTVQVYTSSTVRWLPPHEDELIPEEKRQLILQRVGEAIGPSHWFCHIPHADERERQEALKAKAQKAAREPNGT